MTHPTQNNRNTAVSPVSPDSGPGREKNTRSQARRGVFSDQVDPQRLPRPQRRTWLLVVAVLVIASVGHAQWPVIDVSAVAQLVQTVRLVQDQLTEMTTAKEALLGQVATYTGTWTNLTGQAYEVGEQVGGVVNTAKSLTNIRADLLTRRNAEQLAWPSAADIRTAYAGAPSGAVTQVLRAHQTRSQKWNNERAAWYDSQIMLASTGEFLDEIEATASTQNTTIDTGLSAQLDRQIAVASSARDIAAKQLEMAAADKHLEVQLENQQAMEQAWRHQQELLIRAEIQAGIRNQQASFDSNSFDNSLYAPVLPSY